ncbi:MAG: hypothetical protein KGJ52_07600 [Gammaproteobacteria bacterium]|nr:hypothetical protein [Gammaproteobacteria bacterium]
MSKRIDVKAVTPVLGTLYPVNSSHPDIDLRAPAGGKPAISTDRDGTPYADATRLSA